MYSRSLQKWFTTHLGRVPSEKCTLTNISFSAHAVAQPCKHIGRKAFQALQRLCSIYTISNLDCCQCARMRFHYTSGLLALRICAPQREHCLRESCDPYIENRCYRALNVNSSPNSSHSKIISNE